jgi:hypothetical protein
MALATLSIDIVAQLAKFEGDMRRAAGVVENAAQRMDRAFVGVGAVFTGSLLSNAATEAVRQLAQLVPDLVNSVARFQDLEEKTGASAEALAGFQTAADVSGTSVDTLAGFMVKLTANLSKTSDESKGAGAALKFLGLGLAEFKALKPEDQFVELARALETLPQGASRTATAVALLGKSGADALPFFKELATTGLAQNRLTAEQIRLADDLTDRQAKLRSELRQAAQVVALQALPAFNALVEEFGKVLRATSELDEATAQLGANTAMREWAESAAIGLATFGESLSFVYKTIQALGGSIGSVAVDIKFAFDAISTIGKAGPRQSISDTTAQLKTLLEARNQTAADANDRYLKLFEDSGTKVSEALRSQFERDARFRADPEAQSEQRRLLNRGAAPTRRGGVPDFSDDRSAGAAKALRDAEQARQAQLQQSLKAIEATFASERDAVQFQQQFLEGEYRAGLVTVTAYYAERAALDARALQLELESYSDRAELVRADAQRFKAGTDERIKAETQLQEIEARAAKARQDFKQRGLLDAQAEARAVQQVREQVREFQAELLELQGDAAGAARLRADAAIDKARTTARSLGLPASDAQAFEEATRRVDAFTAAQRRAERAISDAGAAEERFLIAARASGASRAEVEAGVTAIRRQGVEALGDLVRAAEEASQGLGPDSPAVQGARALRLEYERAAAQVDLLALRLQDFADNTAGQIAGSITDAIIDGDWREAGKRIGADLVRGILEEEFTRPLQDELRKVLQGGIGGASGPLELFANVGQRLFVGDGGGAQQPSAQRDALRRIEASVVLDPLGDAIEGVLPRFGDLGTGLSGAAQGLSALPALLQSILGGIGGVGAGVGGFVSSLAGLFGFDEGGYTGNAPATAPAGVVHGREFVFSAPAVRNLGVPALDFLHSQARHGALPTGLPGYADGGFVAPRVIRAAAPPPPGVARAQGGGMTTINVQLSPTFNGVPDQRTRLQAAAQVAADMQEAIERATARSY